MTEMVNGMSQSNDSSSQPVSNTSASQAPVQTASPTAEERTFRQQEVDNIVKRAKNDAVESYRRMQTEQPQYLQQKYGESAPAQQPVHTQAPGVMSQDEIRRVAAEEITRSRDQWQQESQKQAQEQEGQKVVQDFFQKVSLGREKYQDFDSVVSDIEFARFPNVVQLLARHIDNADGVLYELGKDRIKMANLEQLANMSPRDAIVQAKRLADSIRDNEAASKVRQPNDPLSQLRPSNTGTDNGVMGVKDYRAKYRV